MLLRWEGLWMLGEIESFQGLEYGVKERWEELLHCWNLELGRELSNWMEVGGERKCWIGSLAEVVWVVRGLSFFFVSFLTVL